MCACMYSDDTGIFNYTRIVRLKGYNNNMNAELASDRRNTHCMLYPGSDLVHGDFGYTRIARVATCCTRDL